MTISSLLRIFVTIALAVLFALLLIDRDSPEALNTFIRLRSYYLTGFVFLFIIQGISIMLIRAKNKEVSKEVGQNIAFCVQSLILVIFSYALVQLINRII